VYKLPVLHAGLPPPGIYRRREKSGADLNAPACMECGACAGNCPVQTIEVRSGVGCAWAMIGAALRGKDMESGECGCGESFCCGDN